FLPVAEPDDRARSQETLAGWSSARKRSPRLLIPTRPAGCVEAPRVLLCRRSASLSPPGLRGCNMGRRFLPEDGNGRRVCLERRDCVKRAAVGVAATAIAAPAVAATPDAAVRWRLLAAAGTAPGVTDAIDIFARELAALTGGGFQIERIPPGAPISSFPG